MGLAGGLATNGELAAVAASSVNGGVTDSGAGGQWFNVKASAWGAKGDGTTDDTTAIQNAINAAAAVPGGTAFFPAGVYIVSGLTSPPGVVLQGVNAQVYYNATTTVPNSATQSVLKLKAASTSPILAPNDGGTNIATAVHVNDLAFNCNGIGLGASTNTGAGINIPDQGGSISRFWIVERCYIFNVGTATNGWAMYIGQNNGAVTMRDTVLFNGTSGSPAGSGGLGWYGPDGRADNVFIGYFGGAGLEALAGASDQTLTFRGGGIFTCQTGFSGGGGGVVFEGTSIDHNTGDGAYIVDGPVVFVDCTFHTNSTASNGANSNITLAGNNLTVSVIGCRAAPIDTGTNNPAYMIHVTGTGCTVKQFGNYDSGVAWTVGWTNYVGPSTTETTLLGSDTVLTLNATTTLLTSPSLSPGIWLVTAVLSAEFTSASSSYLDFGIAVGTATGAFAGAVAGALSQPSASVEFICQTGTVMAVLTVTAAGTVILRYKVNSGCSALHTGVNTNLGASTGISAVRIADLY